MRINHNIAALNTYNKLSANQATTAKSLEKLSSGLKINKAGDNAAGLAISEKMRGQIRGLDQASTNASDAISLINTAEGALSETHSILQRMRELAVQSSNDTNVTVDRSEIQKEMNQLTNEINRIGNTTEFNTQKLLDGGGSKVTPLATTTVTTGGVAGSVGSFSSTVSDTGKSTVSFTAGTVPQTISLQSKDTATDLGGKKIQFVSTVANTATSGTVTYASGTGTITIDVASGATVAQIQTLLDSASAMGEVGTGLTISITSGDGSAATTLVSGDAWAAATATAVSFSSNGTETKGIHTFDVKNAFVTSGDSFKLKIANGNSPDGFSTITLFAGSGLTNGFVSDTSGTFDIGSGGGRLTAEQQAANIAEALNTGAWDLGSGTTISGTYNITTNGSQVILTEKNALGPQVGVKSGGFAGTTAAQGVSTYTHTDMVEVGGSFIIDDVEIRVVDGNGQNDTEDIALGKAILSDSADTFNTQMEKLKNAITSNTDLNTKYTATRVNADLTLTQKPGQESSAGPVMETSNVAGQKFNAKFQIGANSNQSMTIDIEDMRAVSLGISSRIQGGTTTGAATDKFVADKEINDGTTDTASEYALDVSTHEKATAAITVINDAIQSVSAERSKLGSFQNRLEHTINNLSTSSENMTSAESRIRDVDMAKEMMEFTKNNILSQAAQSMLAQANQQPQGVLQLLQ